MSAKQDDLEYHRSFLDKHHCDSRLVYPPGIAVYEQLASTIWYNAMWTTLAGYLCWAAAIGAGTTIVVEIWQRLHKKDA